MAKNKLSPIAPSEWNEAHARHLLNRAGFGVPHGRVQHLTRIGPAQAVAEMLHATDFRADATPPKFIPEYESYRQLRRKAGELDEDGLRQFRQRYTNQERANVFRLQSWWYERMVNSPRPLEEKMALFWHGHFAASAQKVRTSRFIYDLNQLFREQGMGNFKALTLAVGQSPAMLRYLDNDRNVKGKPNENWARELLELFTLGVGNYTEHDIKESARAFTGWTMRDGAFAYNSRAHDHGLKSFMGQTGNLDGWDIIDTIFQQPAAARRISRKLFEFFAYPDPDPEIIDALASNLRYNNYEIRPLLNQLFRSKVFYSKKAIGTQIKSPVQFVVQLARDLNLSEPPYAAMAEASANLGQNLFFPPNVAGWAGGRTWINANTLLERYNLPRTLVVAERIETEEMSMMDMPSPQASRRKAYRREFEEYMERQSPRQRKAIRTKIRAAQSPEERQKIVQGALFESSASEGWDLKGVFDELQFDTARECASALSSHFLSAPISKKQIEVLASSLSRGKQLDAALDPKSLTIEEMSAALHLVFSLAEYQLC